MNKQQWPSDNPLSCPIVATISILGGKWKPMIVHMLSAGTLRFGEIKRNIPPISQKMLTQQLRELEAAGIVQRTIYAEVPPRVEYALTTRGTSLKPLLDDLYTWGEEHALNRQRPVE
jgi:DNA-binding HxlR family transcriptional regulator